MRIDAINRMYEAYKTQSKSASSKVNKTESKDQVALSTQAKDFSSVMKMLSDTPEVRQDKVDEIKQKMADGSYEMDPMQAAGKILSQFNIKG